MRTRRAGRPQFAVPPWGMAIGSMLSIQLCAALSVGLIGQIGPSATAWLRLCAGAVIFLIVARPPVKSIRRRDLPALLGLGAATGVMMLAFLAAIERIPLGTAVSVEFLGPLTVAALRVRSTRVLVWPALAFAGVVLLTEPWLGEVDPVGLGLAALSGAGWGIYILLTQRVGDRFTGISALSLTIPIAAVLTAFVGVPPVVGHLEPSVLLATVGLALLAPVVPFMLEMIALRRMTHTAFGTLMALEPAFAVAIGLLVLHQQPSVLQLVGIGLVVIAGASAQRTGLRTPDPEHGPLPLDSPETATQVKEHA